MCWSRPWTQSTSLPVADQTQAKTTKNVRGKSHPQQRKISSKTTKGKQQLKQPLAIVMTLASPEFVMGRPLLTINVLHKASKPCVKLHNYYINNYKLGQEIIVAYKDRRFLVGDDIFLISWSDLYDLFNLDMLDVFLMRCFAL
jgi:hypothetical protein